MLEQVELRAAALRPEVQRDSSGVTELEFTICMAAELGMVEMKQLTPFIDQFRSLDLLGNGRLGMQDLNAQTALVRKLFHGGGHVPTESGGGEAGVESSFGTLASFVVTRADNAKKSSSRRLQLETSPSKKQAGKKGPVRQRSQAWEKMGSLINDGSLTSTPRVMPRSGAEGDDGAADRATTPRFINVMVGGSAAGAMGAITAAQGFRKLGQRTRPSAEEMTTVQTIDEEVEATNGEPGAVVGLRALSGRDMADGVHAKSPGSGGADAQGGQEVMTAGQCQQKIAAWLLSHSDAHGMRDLLKLEQGEGSTDAASLAAACARAFLSG